jgi:hypothetical protein
MHMHFSNNPEYRWSKSFVLRCEMEVELLIQRQRLARMADIG